MLKKWKKTAFLVFAVLTAVLMEAGGGGTVYAQEQPKEQDAAADTQSTAGDAQSTDTRSTAEDARGKQVGTVRIAYRDDVDGTEPVAGAEFTFWRIENGKRTEAGKVTTDKDGNAVLKLPEGYYEGEETKPAAGHKASAAFRFFLPMTDEDGSKRYNITITPKAVHKPHTPHNDVTPTPEETPSVTPTPTKEPSLTPAPPKRSEETPVPKQKTVTIRQRQTVIKKSTPKRTETNRKTEPVKTGDSQNEALYLIMLGSVTVVILVMLNIRRRGRRHE